MAESRRSAAKNEQPEDRKPVWNTTTMGPVPEGREDVYDVVGPPEPTPQLNPSGDQTDS